MSRFMLIAIAAAFGLAGICNAQVDSKGYSATISAVSTSSTSITIKGKLESVKTIVPPLGTCTVALVTSAGETLFNKACTAGTNFYRPRTTIHNTSGTALTDAGVDITNAHYTAFAVVDDVTVTLTGASTVTGTVSTVITFDK